MSQNTTGREVVVAIDAGTTGVRARAFLGDTTSPVSSYREFTQHFPKPGWVEHDPEEIWNAVVTTLTEVVREVRSRGLVIAAIGITNQRETVVAWDRATDQPLARAIVWQDRRTADRCTELTPHLDAVRSITGLVLDPYFSASKIEWLTRHGGIQVTPSTAFGTIDSWLIWRLSGGRSFVTDSTNASRTMLFDIRENRWSEEMCGMFGISRNHLPRVVASSGRCAETIALGEIPAGVPISGIAGDQQAALFGQGCFAAGSAKNTYGTGSFLLMNIGDTCPSPSPGMLTTVAWDLGTGSLTYALEGAIFVTGAAIQWLRDGLKIIERASDIGPLAASVTDSGGVVVVPAFTGLGSPWWDPRARGSIFGITRGTTRAHIARAVVESIVFQVRDVAESMTATSGVDLATLKVDGGAAVMDLLLQLQADHLGCTVVRPSELETTALGAALLAGLAEGVWNDLDHIASSWRLDREFTPSPTGFEDVLYGEWKRGVERSLNWSRD
jgi:glycerol kinase